jgi:hypothetical protein
MRQPQRILFAANTRCAWSARRSARFWRRLCSSLVRIRSLRGAPPLPPSIGTKSHAITRCMASRACATVANGAAYPLRLRNLLNTRLGAPTSCESQLVQRRRAQSTFSVPKARRGVPSTEAAGPTVMPWQRPRQTARRPHALQFPFAQPYLARPYSRTGRMRTNKVEACTCTAYSCKAFVPVQLCTSDRDSAIGSTAVPSACGLGGTPLRAFGTEEE